MKVRTNKDGTYHLGDLRRWEEQADGVSIYSQGSDWIVSRWSEGYRANMLQQMPFGTDERYALTYAYCGGDDEFFDYHRERVQWLRDFAGKGS